MEIRAIKVIRPDGRIRRAHVPVDTRLSLTALQTIIGGDIEVVALPGSRFMVIHAEGKDERLPANPIATKLAHDAESIQTDDYIAGTAILAPKTLFL